MTNAEHNRLMDQVHEAQRVVDLAEKEGVFDDCYGKDPRSLLDKRLKKAIRLRIAQRMVELLAGQYPDLKWDIEDTTSTRYDLRGTIFSQRTPTERFHVVVRPRHWHERASKHKERTPCARCTPEVVKP